MNQATTITPCSVYWSPVPRCDNCGPGSTLTQSYDIITSGVDCPTPTSIICPEKDCCQISPWTNWPDCQCDQTVTKTETTKYGTICQPHYSERVCESCECGGYYGPTPTCATCGPKQTFTIPYIVTSEGPNCPDSMTTVCPGKVCCDESRWSNWPSDCQCNSSIYITKTTLKYESCVTTTKTHPCTLCHTEPPRTTNPCIIYSGPPPGCKDCGPASTVTQVWKTIQPGPNCPPEPTPIYCPGKDCCKESDWTQWGYCPCNGQITISKTTSQYDVCSTSHSTSDCASCSSKHF